MSIIDQIRALIKAQIRREELNFASLGGGGQTMNIGALEWVLKQLDTLQEQPVCRYDGITPDAEKCKGCTLPCEERPKEQPVCEDVEKEYEQFCKDYPFPWDSQYINREYIDELCLGVARHFYELGRQSKPEVSEELETEIKNWGYGLGGHDAKDWVGPTARHFAQWQKDRDEAITDSVKFEEGFKTGREVGAREQKEQMMKEAVKGCVLTRDIYDKRALDIDFVYPDGLKPGDKVRIVIVKED